MNRRKAGLILVAAAALGCDGPPRFVEAPRDAAVDAAPDAPSGGVGSWTPITRVGAPFGRALHAAVWTGSEMLIWGGTSDAFPLLFDGGRYDPASDAWRPISFAGAPSPRYDMAGVWTGHELIIWGGWGPHKPVATGARYDPATDTWTPMSTVGAPAPRIHPAAVWTGTELVVWGGRTYEGALLADGARYDPATDTWTAIATNTANATSAYEVENTVWTGSDMIVLPYNTFARVGARYHFATDTWSPLGLDGSPGFSPLDAASDAWTGSDYLVVGVNQTENAEVGGRYEPMLDAWLPISMSGAPSVRVTRCSSWMDHAFFVWGGNDLTGGFARGDGAIYDPALDQWTAIAGAGAPSARVDASAVWTGREVVVWGGFGDAGELDSGARFRPP